MESVAIVRLVLDFLGETVLARPAFAVSLYFWFIVFGKAGDEEARFTPA